MLPIHDDRPIPTEPTLRLSPDRPPIDSVTSAFEPRRVANALKHHWFLVLAIGSLVSGALATAAWTLIPSKYTTYAIIRVSMFDPVVLQGQRYDNAAGRTEFVTYLKTQAKLITSHFVLYAAIRDDKIDELDMLKKTEDPIRWLEENLQLEFSENSEILKIALTGDKPEELAKIVNAVQKAYMKEVFEKDRLNKQGQLEILEGVRKKIDDTLQSRLKSIAVKKDPRDPSEKGADAPDSVKVRMGMVQFQRLNDELSKAQVEQEIALQRVRTLEAKLLRLEAVEVSTQELEDVLNKDPEMKNLIDAFEAAEKRASYKREVVSSENHPEYQDALKRVETARAAADAYRRKIKGDLTRRLQAVYRNESGKELEKAREQAAGYSLRIQKLQGQIAAIPPVAVAAAADPMERSLAYDTDRFDFQHGVSLMNDLVSQINLLRVQIQSPARVRLLQSAAVPIKREMKKQLMATGGAGLLGFVLIGGLVVVAESRIRRVFSSKDLSPERLNIVGSLPDLNAVDARLKTRAPDGSVVKGDAYTEAVDKLRLLLLRNLPNRRSQTILIASAEAGEGKTTLAGHLALSLTKSDRKTVIVDANLRKPAMHRHLGLAVQPGMCEVLRGENALQEVVQRTAIDNLWFLPAGEWDGSAKQALARDRTQRIIERLRQDFDYVVIDSHALLPAADTLQLAQHCDSAIICARRLVTRVEPIDEAYRKLCDLGIPHVGVVYSGDSPA
jgi:Mrp family chromosome partitioning ATPase/capsular polysaccharide biosynthesis protein